MNQEQKAALKLGDKLRFIYANLRGSPRRDVVIEYQGPGYGDHVFAGKIVETNSDIHVLGSTSNDWAYSAFEPITTPTQEDAPTANPT